MMGVASLYPFYASMADPVFVKITGIQIDGGEVIY
jgi:hypothetical protein